MTTDKLNTITSISGAIFAWITVRDVQIFMTLVATIVSCATGVAAFLFYLKRLKSKRDEKGIE